MKVINRERLKMFLWGPENAPFSMRKQITRIITFCCVLAVSVQAVVMVTMLLRQYVRQEKADSLYMLEMDNKNLDAAFRYVEDMILSIQHHTGLKKFFQVNEYDMDTATEELKTAANLFGERNHPGAEDVFVEKIYIFNSEGNAVSNLYYPVTMSDMSEDLNTYKKIYETFAASEQNFYYRVHGQELNLCLWLYDKEMEPLGACIFVLNKSYMEENYANLKKFSHYRWQICHGEDVIFEKEEGRGIGQGTVIESSLDTGFGLALYAGIPSWAICQFLGKMITILFLISLLLVLVLSFCGHKLAVYYVKPLETIEEKIRLVGKGNFNTKLSGYRSEELQNISRTFNEMTDYIEYLVKEVYETQLLAQQAQIRYLQTQMNPHFLSNVLTMIETRAAMNQDQEVQQMIHQLAKLYQGKIFRKDENFISLKEEMEIVEFYLSLQTKRFGEKITYSVVYENISNEHEALLVPRLSIEPIVENAVCHGLQPKAENGCIRIKILKEEHCLKIYIEDDGVGFDINLIAEKKESQNHTHVGLWNTNKMICNLCGEEYGLQIESEIGKGTTVWIVLPIKYGEEYVESNGCG